MKIPNQGWVVVADGGKYLVLRNEGDEELINLIVHRHKEQDIPPSRELADDRPGRYDDAGVGRSAVEETDWHEIAKERFAKELADRLRKWALDQKFDHLVVVADPSTLGELRPQLHDEVQKRIAGEIAKDLTNHPISEIEKALAKD